MQMLTLNIFYTVLVQHNQTHTHIYIDLYNEAPHLKEENMFSKTFTQHMYNITKQSVNDTCNNDTVWTSSLKKHCLLVNKTHSAITQNNKGFNQI